MDKSDYIQNFGGVFIYRDRFGKVISTVERKTKGTLNQTLKIHFQISS